MGDQRVALAAGLVVVGQRVGILGRVTGIVVLVILCAAPLLKLWVSEFAYKGLAAVSQPVSDKRIVNCLSITADAIKLLAYAVGLAGMFFAVSIAIISAMTN